MPSTSPERMQQLSKAVPGAARPEIAPAELLGQLVVAVDYLESAPDLRIPRVRLRDGSKGRKVLVFAVVHQVGRPLNCLVADMDPVAPGAMLSVAKPSAVGVTTMPAVKDLARYALACTVIAGIVLSILTILAGSWDWFPVRVILTSFTVSGASICALACAALRERDRAHILPLPGLVLSLAGAVLVIFGLWSDVGDPTYGQLTASVVVFATATAHLSLLSLARLSNRFTWALVVAYAAIYGLAATLTFMLWLGPGGPATFQFLAILAIVSAGVSILIPIFHGISRSTNGLMPTSVAGTCPICGAAQMHALGVITCERCGSVFSVKVIRDNRVRP